MNPAPPKMTACGAPRDFAVRRGHCADSAAGRHASHKRKSNDSSPRQKTRSAVEPSAARNAGTSRVSSAHGIDSSVRQSYHRGFLDTSLELLDASGNSVKRETGYFWMRRGEQRVCVGCHAGPETAPENAVPQILLKSTTPADLTETSAQSAGGH